MTKVKIEGAGATMIGKLITKSLRQHGLEINHWYNLKAAEVPKSRRDAKREKADVSIVSMREVGSGR